MAMPCNKGGCYEENEMHILEICKGHVVNRADILSCASACVLRDRAAIHGRAENGFDAIAQVWAALDQARGDRPRSGADVALYLAGLKLIRAATNPAHADNWIDLAGYAACGGEIATGGGGA